MKEALYFAKCYVLIIISIASFEDDFSRFLCESQKYCAFPRNIVNGSYIVYIKVTDWKPVSTLYYILC